MSTSIGFWLRADFLHQRGHRLVGPEVPPVLAGRVGGGDWPVVIGRRGEAQQTQHHGGRRIIPQCPDGDG
eukprot:7654792-Pyramimonas_sp.AAC.2